MKINLGKPLQTAAKEIGKHVRSLHRWRERGIRGVFLHCTRVGGRWYVTEESLETFFAALSAGRPASIPPPTTRAAHQRAEKALDDAGF